MNRVRNAKTMGQFYGVCRSFIGLTGKQQQERKNDNYPEVHRAFFFEKNSLATNFDFMPIINKSIINGLFF
jgi:hypothetical protein